MATSTRYVLILLITLLTLSNARTIKPHQSHSHAGLHKRDLNIATDLTGQWTSKGCFVDSVDSRALPSRQYNDDNMTQEKCVTFCNGANYAYAGVEYATQCFCANFVGPTGTTAADTDCNMACGGNNTEACGGPNRLNVFHNDAITTPAPGPATNAGALGWGFIGCYTDNVQARTLSIVYDVPGGANNMSVANCISTCGANGYNYCGVEYSGECHCGHNIANGGAPAPDGLNSCNMLCNGNNTEFCGGPNRLDVYQLGAKSIIAPPWAPLGSGCYNDSVTARVLSHGMDVPGGPTNMTQENCQAACFAGGYVLAGVEYSQECYCDNQLENGGAPQTDGCNMACKGNTNTLEMCGGANRLNVFTYVGGPSTSTTAAPTSTTSTTSTSTPDTGATTTLSATSTTTSSQAIPTAFVGNWTYQGCYTDNTNGRILFNQLPDSTTLTRESCVQSCSSQGYTVAGMEYSSQCFCGNAIVNGGALSSKDSDCAMTCSGNSAEVCGGPNLMSIFATGNVTIYPVPTVQTKNLPGNWEYQGCLNDNGNTRVLPYQIDMVNNASAPNCLALCGEYGYNAAGIEYGSQCFCGDDFDRSNAGATYAPDSSCNFACTGDPTSNCGAGLLLSYYSQPIVDVWEWPEGDAAGKYEFLIGGTVIPLMTAQVTNGKVIFVEKHGTGPPNSTGSFELDLSAIDDWDVAWRELQGLKTDVFCSAGLILPDTAGRLLNIGGWSLDSTYGVRLYTPDSSPGVPGLGQWEENVDELSLQIGRWYPSAMMMANGSILVAGGESGSNAPAVPYLEVLPKPAGGGLVFADWLNRTDPNNLYPFMAVLPGGGIFVAYYNEARVLDEVTLETKYTLPNIPGAVNNFLAGRTYPLEGTSMILPQSYPWTDPLTIMICGGSTPYQGVALDNCVTIQPEVPGANWTIERMPSQRVMPSIVALPDGTYLIVNGAQQGFAGFGLGNDPNHNALLYDPSKPPHQRMSSLANTTVDRLYHNEATLLQDGRVLISGSDPENQNNLYPQEYRVEVFIPPYLMALDEPLSINSSAQVHYTAGQSSNGTNSTASAQGPYALSNSTSTNSSSTTDPACGQRPVFNFAPNNTDWTYGGTYTFTVSCGTVGKVSMMGGVVSTHGNSMGQRTLFPQWSCDGNTCSVTAPPNVHVAGGPAWFMVFIMGANGVPSIAEWIRLGGDPGNLGQWPDFDDFTLPATGAVSNPR